MSEGRRLAGLMQSAYAGDPWHGPSLRSVLAGITVSQALARPLPQAHTIWEVVLHTTVWKEVVRRRLEGDRVKRLPAGEDWPRAGTPSPAAWRQTLARLDAAHRLLHRSVGGLSDVLLARIVPGARDTVYEMVHGVIHHDLYHAGQIALLKKAQLG